MVTIRDFLVSYIELLGYIEIRSGYIEPGHIEPGYIDLGHNEKIWSYWQVTLRKFEREKRLLWEIRAWKKVTFEI